MLLAAGQTELPTCPVCLERLDEHISGVVTTVSSGCAFLGCFSRGCCLSAQFLLLFLRGKHVLGHFPAGLVSGLHPASAAVILLCSEHLVEHRVPSPHSNMSCISRFTHKLCHHLQVCNHRFHNECLQRWGDTKCPVCRYCAQSSNDQSKCNSCSSTQASCSVPVVPRIANQSMCCCFC